MSALTGLTALYNALDGGSWTTKTNWLTGSFCSWHGVVCDGTALSRLTLSSNGLWGTLPTEVGLLSELRYQLDLYDNTIRGHIPTELAALTTLWSIDLQRNELSGSLPTEVGGLARLSTMLHVHYNPSLSGTLPTELGLLTGLRSIFVTGDRMSGTLPAIMLPSSLSGFGLDHNSFSGFLPSEIGRFTGAGTLRLRANSISGTIPLEIGALSNLCARPLSLPVPPCVSSALPTPDGHPCPWCHVSRDGSYPTPPHPHCFTWQVRPDPRHQLPLRQCAYSARSDRTHPMQPCRLERSLDCPHMSVSWPGRTDLADVCSRVGLCVASAFATAAARHAAAAARSFATAVPVAAATTAWSTATATLATFPTAMAIAATATASTAIPAASSTVRASIGTTTTTRHSTATHAATAASSARRAIAFRRTRELRHWSQPQLGHHWGRPAWPLLHEQVHAHVLLPA